MSIAPGQDIGGIKDEQTLRARCRIEEPHECWRWAGKASKRGPKLHIRHADGTYGLYLGRRAAAVIANGAMPLPRGKVAYPSDECSFFDCVFPGHSLVGTRKQSQRAAAKRGCLETPARVAALNALQQAMRKVSREETAEIANGTESAAETAKRYGISKARVLMIRRGGVPKKRPTSVFEWRP